MNVLTPIINKTLTDTITDYDSDREFVRRSLQDHRQIVRFLEAGNAEGARTAMHLHIIRAFEQHRIDIT